MINVDLAMMFFTEKYVGFEISPALPEVCQRNITQKVMSGFFV